MVRRLPTNVLWADIKFFPRFWHFLQEIKVGVTAKVQYGQEIKRPLSEIEPKTSSTRTQNGRLTILTRCPCCQ